MNLKLNFCIFLFYASFLCFNLTFFNLYNSTSLTTNDIDAKKADRNDFYKNFQQQGKCRKSPYTLDNHNYDPILSL